jgi:hypothetical protein
MITREQGLRQIETATWQKNERGVRTNCGFQRNDAPAPLVKASGRRTD